MAEAEGRNAIGHISPDELLEQAKVILKAPYSPNGKFGRLNDLLIQANFLASEREQCAAFAHLLLAKAQVLSDQTNEIRKSVDASRAAMIDRRNWSNMLASKSARFADSAVLPELKVQALHQRAVNYNAMERYDKAVTCHGRVLSLLSPNSVATNAPRIRTFTSRILRERAVCMAKSSTSAARSTRLASKSLEIAQGEGEPHGINDARIRCCETALFLDDARGADQHLGVLLGDWGSMDPNLKAITMKLQAKLQILRGELEKAGDTVLQGKHWCAGHNLYHQAYHFQRLLWQLRNPTLPTRSILLT